MGRVKRQAAVFKFKPFSKQQLKVLTWWMPNSPMRGRDGIIADGAVRSGKTLSMALSFVIWAMESFNGQSLGMCGKTILSFRRNVLSFLVLCLRSRGYGTAYNRSDNVLEVTRHGKTNSFWVFGGKDERAQDLIQGMTLAGVFFDEVALMPESFVNQATARCSVDGSKLWFNCNPEGPIHWFKLAWIDKTAEKNMLYVHFVMSDNLSLSEQIRTRYHSMYSGVFWKRFIEGLWVIAEGVIYDMFDPEKHIWQEREQDDFIPDSRYISVDYGTQNPTVFLLWEKLKTGKWIATKEYYYGGRETGEQKTDSQYADELEKFIPKDNDAPLEIRSIIVDPSAASFIAELKSRGHRVKHANNAVLDGIRLVCTLLNLGDIGFAPCCTRTIGEFSMYAWDEKAMLRGEDAPMKEMDHCMDAVRYFAYTVIRRERKWKDDNV
jgi:PBSX family phage terminase large subunit